MTNQPTTNYKRYIIVSLDKSGARSYYTGRVQNPITKVFTSWSSDATQAEFYRTPMAAYEIKTKVLFNDPAIWIETVELGLRLTEHVVSQIF